LLSQGIDLDQDLSTVLADRYVHAIDHLFNDWNDGRVVIKKQDVESEFYAAVQRRAESPVHDYEKASSYAEEMKVKWTALPAVLEKKIPLSIGARMMLLGAAYDKREGLARVLPDPAEFADRFQMEIFLALAASQQIAIQAKDTEIDTIAMNDAFMEFRSLIYPFCCWKTYR
jgi:hypothetical protein